MVCHPISIFRFTRLLSRGNYSLSNGRFRISGEGGARFRILGGQEGTKFPTGICRHTDVDAT